MMEESQAVEQFLRCKQSIMSKGKQSERAGKTAAGRRHLANGLLAANSSGVEPRRAPAARWEKAGFQTVTNRGKAQPAWLR